MNIRLTWAFGLALLLAVVASTPACDVIPSDERLEGEGVNVIPIDTSGNDTTGGGSGYVNMDTVPSTRYLLLEDFTGIQCGFCPPAAVEYKRLLSLPIGERLVVVGLHAGGFAVPAPAGSSYFTEDFRTAAAEQLFADFQVPGTPRGMINRQQLERSGTLSYHHPWSSWEQLINTVIDQPAVLKLHVKATVNQATRQLQVVVNSKALQTLPAGQFLNVWVLQDSVYTAQKWYNHSPEVEPYYNQGHLFRGSLTGTYGQLLGGTGNLAQGQQVAQQLNLSIPTDWNLQHLQVVAFVANAQGQQVQQVVQRKVALVQ